MKLEIAAGLDLGGVEVFGFSRDNYCELDATTIDVTAEELKVAEEPIVLDTRGFEIVLLGAESPPSVHSVTCPAIDVTTLQSKSTLCLMITPTLSSLHRPSTLLFKPIYSVCVSHGLP